MAQRVDARAASDDDTHSYPEVPAGTASSMTKPSLHDLDLATQVRPRGANTFDLDVPEGWQQGKGAYGGLSLAAMVRAIELSRRSDDKGEDRPLRSLTAELPSATLVGPAQIVVEPVRIGKGVSTFSAKLVQGGEVRALATAILAAPRAPSAARYCELVAPSGGSLPAFEDTPVLPMHERGGPIFSQHFEYRSPGPYPFAGGTEALALGWVRAREPGTMSPAAFLVALADVYWPATFARAEAPFGVGTVAFTLQLPTQPNALDLRAPVAYRARTWVQSDGFFVEQRELWSEAGCLLALNQQSFAILG